MLADRTQCRKLHHYVYRVFTERLSSRAVHERNGNRTLWRRIWKSSEETILACTIYVLRTFARHSVRCEKNTDTSFESFEPNRVRDGPDLSAPSIFVERFQRFITVAFAIAERCAYGAGMTNTARGVNAIRGCTTTGVCVW